MIDAHCHLYESEDIEGELAEFRAAGGEALICAGAGVESSRRAAELAGKHKEVYATVGIHPEEGEIAGGEPVLLALTKDPKVVAIGEGGLDYREGISEEEKKAQRELFEVNINLAKETGLPLVVHCRNAFEDVWEMVRDSGVTGQMHCWTGDEEWMKKFAGAGWYISFGGIVTFKNGRQLREVAGMVPGYRLLAETDAPYLAPEPIRGSRNTTACVKYVITSLAEARGESYQELEKITSENARRLFGL